MEKFFNNHHFLDTLPPLTKENPVSGYNTNLPSEQYRQFTIKTVSRSATAEGLFIDFVFIDFDNGSGEASIIIIHNIGTYIEK